MNLTGATPQTLRSAGSLEELYRALATVDMGPGWNKSTPSLYPSPKKKFPAAIWHYAQAKAALDAAGRLINTELAERRNLILANTGAGSDYATSTTLVSAYQMIMPGEHARSHRHTPNAVRMVVEGDGAWSAVDGEKCTMLPGDLILTPTGLWHEHGHDGDQPVVWLDVLDLPLVHYMEASYHVDGGRQTVAGGRGERAYARGGVVPTPVFQRASERGGRAYPMLRYPWADTRAALEALAADRPELEAVQVSYVNPETGADAQNILGFHALMLRPSQTLRLPVRSPAVVFHVIEGAAAVQVEDQRFALAKADTCCAPGYCAVTLTNASLDTPSFLFIADETPLHKKLGIFETRA